MRKNKYLISSGCSMTEGHVLGESASWATYLAQELVLELINLAKGGQGNEFIINKVIEYGTLRPDIAQDSLFVIQLSECLRYVLPYENLEDYSKSEYTHITSNQFIKENAWYSWNTDIPLNKWIYDNRHILAPLYLNITYSLKKTYNDIINLVNFCESNNHPYMIFDGINNHIPYEENGEWYLSGTSPEEKFLLHTLDFDKEMVDLDNSPSRKYTLEDHCLEVKHLYPFYILKDLIEYIKTLKYYYHGTTLFTFMYDSNNLVHEGHPNELGAKKWAKHLIEVLDKYYE